MGFSGVPTTLPYTKPLTTQLGNQTVLHPFVYSPDVPSNLLGRDLLTRLGATILCSPVGLTVSLPDGTQLPCDNVGAGHSSQYLIQPVVEKAADIYWGLLHSEPQEKGGILSAYLEWKPWISQLHPYVAPPDPPHVTLFYDRQNTEWYEEQFSNDIEGTEWSIDTESIYVAPIGVAAGVTLLPAQQQWYMMGDEAAPHVSLALHPDHQAKELGSIVKTAEQQTDWQLIAPQVMYSPTAQTYKIRVSCTDQALVEHVQISRHHGREKTDHPDAANLLNSLPDTLWSAGPTDVGLVDCPPISFALVSPQPIWLPQYPHKHDAEVGIADTINGLLEKGVLIESQSSWNTPILPIEKKGTGKYRMVHDLRAINAALQTKTTPVPNPYVALTNLDPRHQWFTCIDLANAFFCLPLAEHCRDVFSFTYQGAQLTYSRLPQGFALSPGLFNQVLKDILADCDLPPDTTLVQYVDDLLLAAPTASLCLQATEQVLLRLAEKGFKA
uniref:ribonuclease H n=1 Tax=Seriola lalandi dorsalis TaxID=1841481 RepID=A0A3B4WJT3_SERLL